MTKDLIGEFVNMCCNDEEVLTCKNSKEVFNTINGYLQKRYKNRANKERIAHIANDITESICLKLNIKE